ncbi:MAG: hypothetical protein GVY07_05975 [Bacteroidetes bacterium]|jgi:hypothetical protein|nr:hypothetical protein [Bacteroidota bacterium]
MKEYLIRLVLMGAFLLFYISLWTEVRSAFTYHLIVPQIESAAGQCDASIEYQPASDTAVVITRNNVGYRFNAPAGFYLLFAVSLIILFGGRRVFYWLIVGYHLGFAVLVLSTFYLGLCLAPVILHLSPAGNAYFTPFFTFFVLIVLFFPSIRHRFNQKS